MVICCKFFVIMTFENIFSMLFNHSMSFKDNIIIIFACSTYTKYCLLYDIIYIPDYLSSAKSFPDHLMYFGTSLLPIVLHFLDLFTGKLSNVRTSMAN